MLPHANPARFRWPIVLSIVAALLTIGLKGIAYALTGSVGLLSDALEGGVNLMAAVTAYVTILYAARPADRTHAFGHEKIEFFSSGLEGVLIILAGLGTAAYAIGRLIRPERLEALEAGVLITLSAAAINLVVGRVLLAQGRKLQSIVLEADGKHLMADVWTSLGVVGGLLLVLTTGYAWLDPVVAIVVGLNIVWTGGELVVRSFNGLMDHALTLAEQQQIAAVIEATLPERATFHMLRTRRAGSRRFAEFHLLVEGELSVRAAHHLAHRVEAALLAAVPGLEVMVHIEPLDERDSWESEEMRKLEQPGREGDRVKG